MKRPDGSWVGHREVEKLASLSGIQIRVTLFCYISDSYMTKSVILLQISLFFILCRQDAFAILVHVPSILVYLIRIFYPTLKYV